ncbi:MAG: AsnC family transcriptional regulator [Promethearchaeota archaeon]
MKEKERKFKDLKNDRINFYILDTLTKDGRTSYSKIARHLGLTHVSIKKRIENLINKNIIKVRAEFNFSKFNMKLGLLLLELEYQEIDKILSIYDKCPRVLYSFNIMGKYNLAVLFYGEDQHTFETILNSCMLYNLKGIRKSNLLLIGNVNKPLFFPLKHNTFYINSENAPCGICCKDCEKFKIKQCIGCPASKHYIGPFKAQE